MTSHLTYKQKACFLAVQGVPCTQSFKWCNRIKSFICTSSAGKLAPSWCQGFCVIPGILFCGLMLKWNHRSLNTSLSSWWIKCLGITASHLNWASGLFTQLQPESQRSVKVDSRVQKQIVDLDHHFLSDGLTWVDFTVGFLFLSLDKATWDRESCFRAQSEEWS